MTPKTSFGKIFTAALLAFTFTFVGALQAEKNSDESPAPLDDQRRQDLAVQLFLDGHNFGPGRLDGKWGEFSSKAVQRWNVARPDQKIATVDGELDRDAESPVYAKQELFTSYSISEADLKQIGKVAEEPAEKAKQKSLPYESLRELVAEKFHSAEDFISELNPSVDWDTIKTGDSVQVPNVATPFDISSVPDGNEAADDKPADAPASEDRDAKKSGVVAVNVDMGKEILELRLDGELQASYPITVGTGSNSPDPGDWKIEVVAWMPEFRYDEKMLKEGERSDDAHMLPSGPNNPVGIVWVGLTADGIGIHGTSDPDAIGRNSSAGCIRLSNWDALSFAEQVEGAADVSVKIVE